MPRLAAAHTSNSGAAGNGRSRLVGVHLLQHAEPTHLPASTRVEIGAVSEQDVQQIKIGPRDMAQPGS